MASAVIDLSIGKLGSFLESEASLLAGVHDELEEIKLELLTMKAFLADAERKGALSEVEKTWVENVRDVSMDVQDIIDEFQYQVNKQRSWGPYRRAFRQTICFPKGLWERHWIATKLQRIIKTIKAIPERNRRYGVDRIEGLRNSSDHYDPNRVKIYGESSLFFKDDELFGIEDAKAKLVGWLLSGEPQRTVISVVGMGGSGKTTLVASTFKTQTAKFHCYAWLTVSKTYNIEDLLRVLITELSKSAMEDVSQDLSNMSYMHLVEMVANYLQPKRYMIVLDDVWNIYLWSQIHAALPDGAYGSRVMLTTRNEDIASFPFEAGSHVHHVQPLNEKAAWALFSKKAFSSWPNNCCPPELESIAWDLLVKCQGLPLGIAALGALMSTRRLPSDWMKFSSTLNWELSNNPKLDVVKSILLLSFNDLSYRLKHCFLYLCIFPEDYVIDSARLFRLWMAEGFVERVEGPKPEDIAKSYVAELTCRCMVQVVRRDPFGMAKTFKVHDLLREIALSISKAEKFCTIFDEQKTNEDSKAPHRLSMQANYGELQTYRDMSKVRTFFIFAPKISDSSSLEKLPSGFKLLRVLDLKHVPISQLPYEIVHFFNMKYLNLKGTKVKELPRDIGKLHNLETLDIRHSKIRSLPAGIVKLKHLRHLLMYHCNFEALFRSYYFFDGTQVPHDICKLKHLQVLDAIELRDGLIKQLGHLTQLTRTSLTNLREADEKDLCKSIQRLRLLEHLFVHTSTEDEVLRLHALPSAPPMLKALGLIGKLESVPLWFHSLYSLTALRLHWSRLTEDFVPHIKALPNLTILRLNNSYLGNQLVFQTGFPRLAELYLMDFSQLNVIIIEKGAMPALQTLVITECMKLEQLPNGIEHLTCLHTFDLVNVPNEIVERIRGEGSLDHDKVQHISEISYHYKSESGWSGERLRSCNEWIVRPSSSQLDILSRMVYLIYQVITLCYALLSFFF
ncbi:NB-ARC domain-containing disease resistance protein [Prunus dulcis]|uniref:NB-ARC domain-containing disease resistance protein n=1 Tax=Prunus dulcis TaxID=3755 RepID=A0A4Y1RWM2_PRUDU|nr:NB-ARC domain-containing disease resistance protein [Prunus dulcis]